MTIHDGRISLTADDESESLSTPTGLFARGLFEIDPSALVGEPMRAARRSFLNALGTCIGGSHHAGVDAIAATAAVLGGSEEVCVPGRSDGMPPLSAATAVGYATHVDDFDDTDLETVIHPSASVLAAVLAVGQERGRTGGECLFAFAIGCEAEIRVGRVMTPWHYDAGWHITGTCGVIGAAVATAMLDRLNLAGMSTAIGFAASQALGQREAFGTMLKPFHPGKAGASGMIAARMAGAGVTAPADSLAGRHGFFDVLSREFDLDLLSTGLGEDWTLVDNAFKPYPCGIVAHPGIDSAREVHVQLPAGAEIQEAELTCHPLVPELMGNPDPRDGLQARFSAVHGVAAGLVHGKAGLIEFSDEMAVDPEVSSVRAATRLSPDPEMPRDSARLRVRLADGTELESDIPHARGSRSRPLTYDELHEKVRDLIEPILPGRTSAVIELVDGLGDLPSLDPLIQATCKPEEA